MSITTVWSVVPGMYEKWVNPANRNDKHYHLIFRSNTGLRQVGKRKYKRVSDLLKAIPQAHRHLLHWFLTVTPEVPDAVQ